MTHYAAQSASDIASVTSGKPPHLTVVTTRKTSLLEATKPLVAPAAPEFAEDVDDMWDNVPV